MLEGRPGVNHLRGDSLWAQGGWISDLKEPIAMLLAKLFGGFLPTLPIESQ